MSAKVYLIRISVLAIIMSVLIACAGGNELSAPVIESPLTTKATPPTPSPAVSHGGPVVDYVSLIDSLRAAGLAVEPGDSFTPDIFTAQGLSLRVNGAPITVYEYPDSETAASEAAWISPDGNRMTYPDPNNPGQMVSMTNEPSGSTIHYYRRDNLIVLYLGDSPPIVQALEAVLGPQFAGGPAPEPGTIPRIFGYGLLPPPNLVRAGQITLPPAWLQTDDSVIPASSSSFEIEDKAQGLVQHADGVPPPLLGEVLATAHLNTDQAVTIIILIPYDSVRSLRATIQPWSEEPAFDSSTAQTLTGEGYHREDFYNYTMEPFDQVGDALLTVTMQFDYSQARGEMTYIWRLNPAGTAANTQPTPTPASFPGDFEVVLKATPQEGTAPLAVGLTATLNGGPDNSYELNCGIIRWEMGDGIQIPQEMTCDPWSPDLRIGRRYNMEYTYAQAGTYQAQVQLGQDEDDLSSNVVTVEVR